MTEHKNQKQYEDVNLTDAVLFMSVMKHKKACRIPISYSLRNRIFSDWIGHSIRSGIAV